MWFSLSAIEIQLKMILTWYWLHFEVNIKSIIQQEKHITINTHSVGQVKIEGLQLMLCPIYYQQLHHY